MENVKKLLDEVKRVSHVESDYALAKTLDLPKQRISDYYKGRTAPDKFACLRISEILGKSLDEVVTAVELDAEKDEKRRLAWQRHYKSIGGIAASFMLIAFAFVTLIVTCPTQALAATGDEKPEVAGIQIIRTVIRSFSNMLDGIRSVFSPNYCAG